MAYPIGQPSYQEPDGDWVGMTPQGVQRALGSSYMNEGILPDGGSVKVKGTSGWSYSVPAMTVFAYTSGASARRGVLIPIEQATIPVSAPVGGASRTDTVYVEPDDGVVRVSEGASTAPGVIIDRVVIPASATNTQGIASNYDTVYAIPAGASLGRLAHYDIPGGTWSGAVGADVLRYTERFTVPTDRLVRVDISLAAQAATAGEGWAAFGVEIDGTWRRALHCVYTDDAERTYSATWTAELAAGAHTLEVFTVEFKGPDIKTAPSASASEVNLWDAGVAI